MRCRLCNQEKEKLCKAHIAPEALYRYMYPNEKVEGDSLILLSGNKNYITRKRIGLYDSNILCAECDNYLGVFDEYGSNILLKVEPSIAYSIGQEKIYTFGEVDVKKLKLFFLSILWRASISVLDEYSQTDLSEKFENRLRKMLLDNDAGSFNDFSVIITKFRYKSETKKFHKFLQVPVRTRMEGLNYYYLCLPNGYKIYIKIDSRDQPKDILPFTIKANESINVMSYELFEDTEDYKIFKSKAIQTKQLRSGINP